MPERSTKFSAIVSFFEMLARQHVSIRHSDSEKHFFRLELDEVFTALPQKARFPLLVLESYSFSINDNKSDNFIKQRQGAFMIIDKIADIGNFDQIHQKWDELEEIGDDILARIREEKKVALSPVRNFNMDSVDANLLMNAGNNTVAMRFTYDIESRFNETVNPSKWMIPTDEP
jgi:hypothetical protein